MSAPQIIMIVWLTAQVTAALMKNGKPIEANPEYLFIGKTIQVGLLVALLWWGGFWS